MIEINNSEVPILDGSAKIFIEKIVKTGLQVNVHQLKLLRLIKIELKDGDSSISIEPSKLSLDIDFELKYQNPVIGNQRNKIKVYEDDLGDIFNSRTFCLFEDVEEIKKKV